MFPSYEAKRRLEIRSRVERKLGFLRGVDSEEFVNVFMRIGFGSTIELVSFDKSQVVTFDRKLVVLEIVIAELGVGATTWSAAHIGSSSIGMDDSNMKMEEYIKLEEEKARKCRKVFNWKTATYGKIRVAEDIHDLRSVETEFPAIDFNDEISSKTLSYEPTVCSLNYEIDIRISFDESDDEDYTIICDKNSFSYKLISINNLKTDSEKNNDKVNIPLLPSPEPTASYFNDLDYFKNFEKEFPAIVYNDAQTSKLNFLIEPTLSP
ncbi:hypothetical protein Tco_0595712 [Tanacetum coccineum]